MFKLRANIFVGILIIAKFANFYEGGKTGKEGGQN
jgi:hypothetical protein